MITASSKEVKKVHAELLDLFINICDKNNLKWCLAYGTLLGAVRDKSFIPWDHDVDVFMPIDDYIKLYELSKKRDVVEYPFHFIGYGGLQKQTRNFKIFKYGTTIVKDNHVFGHVFMDIYPTIDVDSKDEILLNKFSEIASEFKKDFSNYSANKNSEVLSTELKIRNLFKNSKCDKFVAVENTIGYSYIDCRVTVDRIKDNMYPIIDFNQCISCRIDGPLNEVRIPKNYDQILTNHYGNYLKPSKTNGDDWMFDLSVDCSQFNIEDI